MNAPVDRDVVAVVTDTPLVVWALPWSLRAAARSHTIIAKATFAIGDDTDDAPLEVVVDEPRYPEGDIASVHVGDVEALAYASDHAPIKLAADITLSGFAYPEREGATEGEVSLRVGSALDKRIRVVGPRTRNAVMGWSASEPFARVPLCFSRAAGGVDDAENPVGRGAGEHAPQLLHVSRGGRETRGPACFAPVSPTWAARARHLGTYDEHWLASRWPYFADDFDARYFNAALPDQQVAYLRGDEIVEVRGVRPDGARLRGRLPGRRVDIIAQRQDGALVRPPVRLDTLHIDAEARQVVVLWRAVVEVATDADNVVAALVTVDDGKAENDEAVRTRLAEVTAPVAVVGAVPELPELPQAAPASREAIERALEEPAPGGVKRLRRLALRGADLRGLDLRGLDLSHLNLAEAKLEGADLRGANIEGANLAGVHAPGARWDEAVLTGASLLRAGLDDGHFTGATMGEAVFDGATMARVRLDGAQAADGSSFVGVTALEANLGRANLSRSDWSGATLDRARLDGAVLDDAIFYEASAAEASFVGAKAEDVRLDGLQAAGACFDDIQAPGLTAEAAQLPRSSWRGARLSGASFSSAHLGAAVLDGVDAPEASFRGALLEDAILAGSQLRGADLQDAKAARVRLNGACLYQAETWRADLTDAVLDGAFVQGTKLAQGA